MTIATPAAMRPRSSSERICAVQSLTAFSGDGSGSVSAASASAETAAARSAERCSLRMASRAISATSGDGRRSFSCLRTAYGLSSGVSSGSDAASAEAYSAVPSASASSCTASSGAGGSTGGAGSGTDSGSGGGTGAAGASACAVSSMMPPSISSPSALKASSIVFMTRRRLRSARLSGAAFVASAFGGSRNSAMIASRSYGLLCRSFIGKPFHFAALRAAK